MDEIQQHGYDLILLDIKLPDLDGMEILKAIHEPKPTLQVVVMTGHSTIQNAVEAMKLGAFDYLTKPFTDDQLTMTAKNALEKKRLVEEDALPFGKNFSIDSVLKILSGKIRKSFGFSSK